MSEDTTTSEDSVDSGADETAQLDAEDTQTEAVNQDEDTSQTSESDDAES
jgi:hypothetical protein